MLIPLPRVTTKKVENYLDARTGKSGVPLNCVICAAKVDPVDAPDKYTRVSWATFFETQYFAKKTWKYITSLRTWPLKLTARPGSKGSLMATRHAATANATLEATCLGK